MRRFALILVAALCLGFAQASGGARISFCTEFSGDMVSIFDLQYLCNANGYVEFGGFGFFAETSPKYGPFYENFEVMAYKPDVKFELFDLQFTTWIGVSSGVQQGDWFLRLGSDLLFVF